MRRVLFVDDEPLVLLALKNVLRTRCRDWEPVFVHSADAALAALEQASFDVVVTDLEMPRCDGAQLLAAVQTRWPGVGRLLLSGSVDGAVRAPSAHQWLQKPCDVGELRDAVEDCAP